MKKFILVQVFLNMLVLLTTDATAQVLATQWVKTMGGSNSVIGKSVLADSAGNVFSSGTFLGIVDFDPGPSTLNLSSPNYADVFVTKMDAAGNLVWVKQIGGPGNESAMGFMLDNAGNIYISGYFSTGADFDPGPGTYTIAPNNSVDAFICKLDPSGNFIWAKGVGGNGFAADIGYAIAVDNIGNVYTAGRFAGTGDFDPGVATYTLSSGPGNESFLLKLDAGGNFVWARHTISTSGAASQGIAIDSLGNIYTTGYFGGTTDFNPGSVTYTLSAGPPLDIFVAKYNPAGALSWAGAMGASTGAYDMGYSIIADANGYTHITGHFGGTADFDPGPGTFNMTAAGYEDGFICKLNPNGNLIWAKSFGSSPTYVHPEQIKRDQNGNLYTIGTYTGTADFNPGPGLNNLTSAGSQDMFILKLDSAGNYVYVGSTGGTGTDYAHGLDIDKFNNVYLSGSFSGTCDFDPNAGTYTLTTVAGALDMYLHKLSPSVLQVKESEVDQALQVYPNPFTEELFFSSLTEDRLCIELYSVTGEMIFQKTMDKNLLVAKIESVAAGIYFLKVTNGEKLIGHFKLIKN